MDTHALKQIDLFPDTALFRAERFWSAKDRYYASGTLKPPTQIELINKFDPPIPGVRSVDRWRKDNPELYGKWPPKRADRRPWERANNGVAMAKPSDEVRKLREVRTVCQDLEGKIVQKIEYFDPDTNEFVTMRLVDIDADKHS